MEILIYGVMLVLAAAAGYFGGRWHGAHLLASVKQQLAHDTEKFMGMLEERNEDYSRYKANHADQTRELRRLEVELDKAAQRLQTQQEGEEALKTQLAEQDERLQKFKGVAEKWSEERAELLGKQGKLEADSEHQQRESQQLQGRVRSLEERFETAIKEKATLQEQLLSKEREAREAQRQAQKLEDDSEASEFTLSQLRVAKEELATRLAFAEGQLKALNADKSEI